ncbi:MAG: hypothetical protein L6R42_003157 [Xanthoria sp. 1 TBL-2021]|nr:MAG: hypothetical protein L6R42_003157 [Xanthoria sp. 1 TBL-2021]
MVSDLPFVNKEGYPYQSGTCQETDDLSRSPWLRKTAPLEREDQAAYGRDEQTHSNWVKKENDNDSDDNIDRDVDPETPSPARTISKRTSHHRTEASGGTERTYDDTEIQRPLFYRDRERHDA